MSALFTFSTHNDSAKKVQVKSSALDVTDGASQPPPKHTCQIRSSCTKMLQAQHSHRLIMPTPLPSLSAQFALYHHSAKPEGSLPFAWSWLVPTQGNPCVPPPLVTPPGRPSLLHTWKLPRLCPFNTGNPASTAPNNNCIGDPQPLPQGPWHQETPVHAHLPPASQNFQAHTVYQRFFLHNAITSRLAEVALTCNLQKQTQKVIQNEVTQEYV